MWPFERKIRQRRLEVRKNIPTQRGALWRRFAAAGGPGSLGIAAAFFVIAAASVVLPPESFNYREGQVAAKIYARIDFRAPNAQWTEEARDHAGNQTASIYAPSQGLLSEVEAQLQALPGKAKNAAGDEKSQVMEQFALKEEDLALLVPFADAPDIHRWKSAVVNAVVQLGSKVILSPRDFKQENGRLSTEVLLDTPDAQVAVDKRMITATNEPNRLNDALASVVDPFDKKVRPFVRGYLLQHIKGNRPTYTLDVEKTQARIRAAREAVEPSTDAYVADDVIFVGGTLTATSLTILRAEHDAHRKWLSHTDPNHDGRILAGRVIATWLVVAGLCGYIALYQQRIVKNLMRGLGLAALMSIMLTLTKVIVVVGWNIHLSIGVTSMAAVIVAIAYTRRFALAAGGALSMLLVIQLQQDIGFLLTMLTPMAISVLLMKEIRTRSKVIEVGAGAAAAAFLATAITQIAGAEPFSRRMAADCGWAAGGVMAMGFIIQGILPLIERAFHIATAMTLLEWCDANKRLLKRLAMEAPGTFNHSLLLGTLCEAAAETVGGNGLLARVGAYYHDIGKINKPEYFVENQFGSPSKHEKLSPAMSLLIITGHVKDGIEMAKEYNLPTVLQPFIATHHGTTLVQYFYHAATQRADGDRVPDEVEFRYPGPKPQTKEAGILMLADATESSVRAMSDPTPARIEAQAHSVLTARLTDGQLDECDLTLRDAHKIEESLVKSLCGIYHGRIAYPKGEAKPARRSGGHRSTGA